MISAKNSAILYVLDIARSQVEMSRVMSDVDEWLVRKAHWCLVEMLAEVRKEVKG